SKRMHHAQAGGALQGADEPAVPIEEVGLQRPVPHLVESQEKAAGMRVERTDEPRVHSQETGTQFGPLGAVLEWCGDFGGQVAIEVCFPSDAAPGDLESVRQ